MPIQKITSGIIEDGAVSAADIVSVSNTAISGNIISSQITSVANTQITGTITGSQISSNTLSNTVFQTGSVENYMNATGLSFGMRNRIINGAMVIDQRNAGASQTPINGAYMLDRWTINVSQTSKLTQQQNAGAVTPPAGFSKYMGFTSSSAYSLLTTDYFVFNQYIEGLNVADLALGTASAATVSLSFWVRSSLTGTFGGSLRNGAGTRSYPFSYTINTANTWEQKTITVAGDTSGTWTTDTGIGLILTLSLGAGSTFNGTVNAWSTGNYLQSSGATSVVGTNGATFYITGVQLEKGSTATAFDYRDIGRELIMCQRYFERSYNIGSATGSFTNGFIGFNTPLTATSDIPTNILFKVTKRDTPTVVVYNAVSGASGAAYRASDAGSISVTGINYVGTNGVGNLSLASGSVNNYLIHYTASSEL